jgi:hypothetical protein
MFIQSHLVGVVLIATGIVRLPKVLVTRRFDPARGYRCGVFERGCVEPGKGQESAGDCDVMQAELLRANAWDV